MNVRFYLSYDVEINLKSHFWSENVNILPNICDVVMGVISLCYRNLKTTSGLSILKHDHISLPDVMSYHSQMRLHMLNIGMLFSNIPMITKLNFLAYLLLKTSGSIGKMMCRISLSNPCDLHIPSQVKYKI